MNDKTKSSITPEEYKAAKVVINTYEEEFAKKETPFHSCICCGEHIHPTSGLSAPKALSQEQSGAWDKGSLALLSCGYGSRYDFRKYYIAVCDDCLGQAIEKARVVDYEDLERKFYKSIG